MKKFIIKPIAVNLHHWLNTTSIQQRLHYLTLLNVFGLGMLLLLSVSSSLLKDSYFQSIEALNAQQRQIQHFNTETARLRVSIENYITSYDPAIQHQIDTSIEELFEELSALENTNNEYTRNLLTLHQSLRAFITGYHDLKDVNQRIDRIYQSDLIEPSQHAAGLLSIVIGNTSHENGQPLLNAGSVVAVNAFIDSLIKMNAYYATRDTAVVLGPKNSLDRLAQLVPLLESLTKSDIERQAFRSLRSQVHIMVKGLGALQDSYQQRNRIMETEIEQSQHAVAQTAMVLDKRYTEIEDTLQSRYSQRFLIINGIAIMIAGLVVVFTFMFSAMVFKSIRMPLGELLRTVKAYSSGDFEYPVPEVGQHELGLLAAGLKDFRLNALQRTSAEQALRESEGRFRALSDMSSDYFWEQNSQLQYSVFSGQRAGQLLARNILMLGLRAWENPRNIGYEQEWADFKKITEGHQPFRNFESALQMPDGSTLYLLANGDPIFDLHGVFKGYRGTAKDVSAQKAIEAEIRQLNLTLELRVVERTAELRRTNEQLSQAMEQLVQIEKMASLGNLVAGVAHELNTPLGNALIASTSLRSHINALAEMIDSGALRKSDLIDFTHLCKEGCYLIERNTQRAVSLITNFKQVAVDQTSVQRRKFNLLQTIQEVVGTLSPTLRKHQLTLTIDIPDEIILDSYPGPFDQVITNIVTNATVHAFDEGQTGSLLISASKIGKEQVVVMLSDNGRGISTDKQGRVFDPFFTTRLGQGGSGLGLYIVYNIITSLLGGNIQLVSFPGAGTCFIIHLPSEAPHPDENTTAILGTAPSFGTANFGG
jgi:signal transduction histidine kinase